MPAKAVIHVELVLTQPVDGDAISALIENTESQIETAFAASTMAVFKESELIFE